MSKKKRRTKNEWAKKLGRDYLDDLERIVDDLFERAYRKRWSWSRFAAEAGLAYTTVCNLGDGITQLPQYRTLSLLAEALDGHLYFKGGEKKVTLEISWKTNKKEARAHGYTAA